ncbi:hypothetical protein S7711_00802 [Stachybotrys chartarum IBT 7711]|uniref:Uncharacterized protein n=1 Tax=Stachybotrys chartarum (strain CBS 109288 / IBT 7711) TaxID=1280523 RepID=A0A084B086_STACB|nr:hypothetical protein S7711_00802 [Stachybotrys chartarum IBT 7711]KFA49038.1 hypothetical protein S40293_06202 [Stachybotrys chartarum IBT 40293]KFA72505.1 hypothetical protein S40288_06645 [Stachybotrys chartarum IBT 40288]
MLDYLSLSMRHVSRRRTPRASSNPVDDPERASLTNATSPRIGRRRATLFSLANSPFHGIRRNTSPVSHATTPRKTMKVVGSDSSLEAADTSTDSASVERTAASATSSTKLADHPTFPASPWEDERLGDPSSPHLRLPSSIEDGQSFGAALAVGTDLFSGCCDGEVEVMPDTSHTPPSDLVVSHVRSASSCYPVQDGSRPYCQSPASPPGLNRLSLSDLSDLEDCGKLEEGLPEQLRGSSSVVATPPNANESLHEVMTDAAEAVEGWQVQSSSKRCPSNNIDPVLGDALAFSLDGQSVAVAQSISPPIRSPTIERPHGCFDDYVKRSRRRKGHCDGTIDANRANRRLDSSAKPSGAAQASGSRTQSLPKGIKRKISLSSFLNTTNSWAKRPRLGLRKLATAVYHEGDRRWKEVRLQWEQSNAVEKKEFGA